MMLNKPSLLMFLLCLVLSACDSTSDNQKPSNQPPANKISNQNVASQTGSELKVWDVTGASKTTEPYDAAKLAKVSSAFPVSEAPEKQAYQAKIKSSLAAITPVLPIDNLSNKRALRAQQIFLADANLKKAVVHPQSGQATRNEVMSIKPALPGDRVGNASSCNIGDCYRVDIYNFFYNATITGIVDVEAEKVRAIKSLRETQPELSPRLEALAIAIAKHEPAVRYEVERYQKFIGSAVKPEELTPIMAATKSALKNTLCERSKHLCVAPTYVLGDQALWVIVDLTDLKVAGLRWTTVGHSGPPTIITERTLENEYVFKNYCEQVTDLNRSGWSLSYHLTASDGLRIANVRYNDDPVVDSAKVVDWHVAYSTQDGFGYSDATGCPIFSSAVVVAYDGPQVDPIIENGVDVGFSVKQDFRQHPWPAPCNYRYEERYEFYHDGRFRAALSNHGRGCGTDGTYRPVLRIDMGDNDYRLDQWQAEQWQTVKQESWTKQIEKSQLNAGRYTHRFINTTGKGYMLAPGSGQFGDGGRGDNAYIYATVKHPDIDEGEGDLVTLGSCCNSDHQQGPEQFMQPAESLDGEDLILWYVPQMKNDGRVDSRYCWAETTVLDGVAKTQTWPCTGGPMFVPISASPSDSNE